MSLSSRHPLETNIHNVLDTPLADSILHPLPTGLWAHIANQHIGAFQILTRLSTTHHALLEIVWLRKIFIDFTYYPNEMKIKKLGCAGYYHKISQKMGLTHHPLSPFLLPSTIEDQLLLLAAATKRGMEKLVMRLLEIIPHETLINDKDYLLNIFKLISYQPNQGAKVITTLLLNSIKSLPDEFRYRLISAGMISFFEINKQRLYSPEAVNLLWNSCYSERKERLFASDISGIESLTPNLLCFSTVLTDISFILTNVPIADRTMLAHENLYILFIKGIFNDGTILTANGISQLLNIFSETDKRIVSQHALETAVTIYLKGLGSVFDQQHMPVHAKKIIATAMAEDTEGALLRSTSFNRYSSKDSQIEDGLLYLLAKTLYAFAITHESNELKEKITEIGFISVVKLCLNFAIAGNLSIEKIEVLFSFIPESEWIPLMTNAIWEIASHKPADGSVKLKPIIEIAEKNKLLPTLLQEIICHEISSAKGAILHYTLIRNRNKKRQSKIDYLTTCLPSLPWIKAMEDTINKNLQFPWHLDVDDLLFSYFENQYMEKALTNILLVAMKNNNNEIISNLYQSLFKQKHYPYFIRPFLAYIHQCLNLNMIGYVRNLFSDLNIDKTGLLLDICKHDKEYHTNILPHIYAYVTTKNISEALSISHSRSARNYLWKTIDNTDKMQALKNIFESHWFSRLNNFDSNTIRLFYKRLSQHDQETILIDFIYYCSVDNRVKGISYLPRLHDFVLQCLKHQEDYFVFILSVVTYTLAKEINFLYLDRLLFEFRHLYKNQILINTLLMGLFHRDGDKLLTLYKYFRNGHDLSDTINSLLNNSLYLSIDDKIFLSSVLISKQPYDKSSPLKLSSSPSTFWRKKMSENIYNNIANAFIGAFESYRNNYLLFMNEHGNEAQLMVDCANALLRNGGRESDTNKSNLTKFKVVLLGLINHLVYKKSKNLLPAINQLIAKFNTFFTDLDGIRDQHHESINFISNKINQVKNMKDIDSILSDILSHLSNIEIRYEDKIIYHAVNL